MVPVNGGRLVPWEVCVSLTRPITALLIAASFLIPVIAQTGVIDAKKATSVARPRNWTGPLGGDLPGDPQIQLVEVASGLHSPVNVAVPPDGSGRIFVVEQAGTIRIINPDGSVEPEPFLDISATTGNRQGEQGLLGLAFHPDFAKNGRFYIDYNDNYRNGAITVTEFTTDKSNPNKVKMNSERPLLVIEKSYAEHNGGTLHFGQDGYLYISTGDGAGKATCSTTPRADFRCSARSCASTSTAGLSVTRMAFPPITPSRV